MSYYLYSDGGARGNPGPAGAGWVIKKNNEIIKQGFRFLGETTNNQAEYQALIYGLKDCVALDIKELNIYLDSELIVKQILGQYRVKNKDLKPRFKEVMDLLLKIDYQVQHIPRAQNKEADALANKAMDSFSNG